MFMSGLMKYIPVFHPAGKLRLSNFGPDKIVKSTHSHQTTTLFLKFLFSQLKDSSEICHPGFRFRKPDNEFTIINLSSGY